jgi:hypothetical protein
MHLRWETEGRGGRWVKVNLQKYLYEPEAFNTMQKYIIKFHVDNNTMTAPSSTEFS